MDQVNNCEPTANNPGLGVQWAPHLSQPFARKQMDLQSHRTRPFPGPHLCGCGPGDFPGPDTVVMYSKWTNHFVLWRCATWCLNRLYKINKYPTSWECGTQNKWTSCSNFIIVFIYLKPWVLEGLLLKKDDVLQWLEVAYNNTKKKHELQMNSTNYLEFSVDDICNKNFNDVWVFLGKRHGA